MVIYYFVFAVSLVIAWGADRYTGRKKYVRWALWLMIPLFPSLLAGFRDYSIGTDIHNYGKFNFELATRYKHLYSYIPGIEHNNGTEAGYAVLNYLVSRITHNCHVFFFFLEYFMIGVVVAAFKRFAKMYSISMVLMLALWYGMFYGQSLNIMRQSLAMAFVLLAASYLLDESKDMIGRYAGYTFWTVVAISMHRTALVSLVLVVMFVVYKHVTSKCWRAIIFVGLPIVLAFGLPFTNHIILWLIDNVPVLDKYRIYRHELRGIRDGGFFNGLSKQFLLTAIVMAIYFGRHYLQRFFAWMTTLPLNLMIIEMLVIDMLFALMSGTLSLFARLGLFFQVFRTVGYPYLLAFTNRESKFWHNVVYVVILGLAAFSFWLFTGRGDGGIYPYTSRVLFDITGLFGK